MSHPLTGLTAWVVQRLSAIYLALFAMAALLWWWQAPALDYHAWRALFAAPLSGVGITLALIALLLHGWVGMRDVILDYAGGSAALRLCLLALLGGALITMGAWALRILVGVMGG